MSSRLFSPFPLGNLTLPNRCVVAPMTTYSSQPDGWISDDEIPYLRARAEGGFGLVMTAACYVHPSGHAFDGQWSCAEDRVIPSLKAAADAIREGGSYSVLQIHHGGRACPGRLCGGQSICPSPIPAVRPDAETPREMTDEETEEMISAFGQAARRAAEAGFDVIEIHGANTYLLQQFVSPHSNRREDRWGQNRLLFSQRVIDEVLAHAEGLPVGYRFSPEELEEPGIRWEHTADLIDLLCSKGLEFVHVSLGNFRMKGLKGDWPVPTLERVAKQVDGRKTLIGVGNIWTEGDAEEAMDMGADLIAVAKAALTHPDWPRHIAAGGEPRKTIPATGAKELFIWPAGLETMAYTRAPWFEKEGE